MNIFSNLNADDGESPTKKDALIIAEQKFNSLFQTEKDCMNALCQIFSDKEGVLCKHCGSQDMEMEYGVRVGQCRSCKKTTWLMSGTFFHRIKKARPWLLAIWLMEQKVSFNAADLHKLAKIALSTAWTNIKKITLVLNDSLDRETLAVVLSSARFAPAVCKRSLETPANKHPIAEQAEIEKRLLNQDNKSAGGVTPSDSTGNAPTGAVSTVSANELTDSEKKVYQILSREPVHFDDLCEQTGVQAGPLSSILMMLVLDELVEEIPGDRYIRSTPTTKQGHDIQAFTSEDITTVLTTAVTMSIAAGIDFIHNDFHGTSRKYLQLYLAAYWCQVDKVRWSDLELLKACCRFREIKYDEIRAFVSPLLVKIMLC